MAERSILITGSSSGIGYCAAHGLKARGWRVFATCRQEADCVRLRDEGLESFRLDYADPDSLSEAVAEATRRTGGTLDALYNNGAFGMPGAMEDLPAGGLREIFETNVFGQHELTRKVVPIMRAQGHGRVVNCSSVLGFVPYPWRGAYTATKYAVEGLTDTWRLEMADTGIRFILVEPGPITSKMRENAIPHFEKWIDWESSARVEQYRSGLLERLYRDRRRDRFEKPPEAVLRKLVHALESRNPHPRYMVTAPTHFMAAMRRLLPTRLLDALIRLG